MLVLSRKVKEIIVLYPKDLLHEENLAPIKIAVVAIRGDNVRIGIDAPDTLAIDREEVFLLKKEHGTKEK